MLLFLIIFIPVVVNRFFNPSVSFFLQTSFCSCSIELVVGQNKAKNKLPLWTLTNLLPLPWRIERTSSHCVLMADWMYSSNTPSLIFSRWRRSACTKATMYFLTSVEPCSSLTPNLRVVSNCSSETELSVSSYSSNCTQASSIGINR